MSSDALEPFASRVAPALAGVAVVAGTCAAFNGMPRYDVAQLGLGGVAVATASAGLLVAAARGDATMRAGRMLAAWAVVVAWVLGQAVARGNGAWAWDQVVLFGLAGFPLLAACASPRSAPMRSALAAAMGVSAIAFGAAALLQSFGVDVPPAVPFSTDMDAGVRGLSDDPWNAGSWGLVAAPACAALALGARGIVRRVAIAGALSAGLVIGLADQMPMALALLGASAAASVLAFTRPAVTAHAPRVAAVLIAPALVAVAMAAVVSADDVSDDVSDDAASPSGVDELDRSMVNGRFAPWSDAGALSFYRQAARAWALSEPGLGHGPGAFAGSVQAVEDSDATWALRHTSGHEPPLRAPNPSFELLGDYGVAVPLFVLATLLLGLGTAFRRTRADNDPDEAAAAVAGVGTLLAIAAALTLAPGLLTAPAMIAVGAGLAAVAFLAPSHASPGRPALVVGLATVLAAVCAVASVQTLRWGRPAAAGVVYLGHNMPFEAIDRLQTASERQLRYESERNLAVALIFTPAEGHEPRVIVDHLLSAARLRPADAISRYLLANHFLRHIVDLSSDPESLGEHRLEVIAALGRAVELDPNYVDAAILLAQTHMGHMEGAQAREVLAALAERDLPPLERSRVFGQLGVLHAEILDDPEEARTWFERALEVETRERSRRYYAQQIETMELWIASGRRPIIDDTDHPPHLNLPGAPGGHDHGAHDGHDHGAHDGHDHGGDDDTPAPPADGVPAGDDHEDHDHDDHDHDDHDHGADGE